MRQSQNRSASRFRQACSGKRTRWFVEGAAATLEQDSKKPGISNAPSLRGADLPLAKVASSSYISGMRSVGLKVLKNKLSEYVRLAAGGETVLVTDRDRVVAEIVPPQPGRSPLLADALLAEAVREGWVTPPALAGGAAPPRKPVMAFRTLMEEMQRDRDDR